MVYVAQDAINIQTLVQQAIAHQQLRRQDHFMLTSLILNSSAAQSPERFHINRLLDCVRSGKVRLVN